MLFRVIIPTPCVRTNVYEQEKICNGERYVQSVLRGPITKTRVDAHLRTAALLVLFVLRIVQYLSVGIDLTVFFCYESSILKFKQFFGYKIIGSEVRTYVTPGDPPATLG
jgi:hypothetical protein